jgi:hypothetical protein
MTARLSDGLFHTFDQQQQQQQEQRGIFLFSCLWWNDLSTYHLLLLLLLLRCVRDTERIWLKQISAAGAEPEAPARSLAFAPHRQAHHF